MNVNGSAFGGLAPPVTKAPSPLLPGLGTPPLPSIAEHIAHLHAMDSGHQMAVKALTDLIMELRERVDVIERRVRQLTDPK